jgi:uncharacterized damage-inducible protein DinB
VTDVAMMSILRPYLQLARNNTLANRRMQRAVANLQPSEWQAPRTGFFPSICATLNHIYTVDLFYIDALHGGIVGLAAFANRAPYPDPSALATAQNAMDARVLAFVDGLAPNDLTRPVHIHRGDRVQTETVADTLMHLFVHSQHHRGQAHAMLSGSSVPPPQLDEFFMTDDARFRTNDLANLGWNEAQMRATD